MGQKVKKYQIYSLSAQHCTQLCMHEVARQSADGYCEVLCQLLLNSTHFVLCEQVEQ